MFGKKKLREANELLIAQVDAMQEHIDRLVGEREEAMIELNKGVEHTQAVLEANAELEKRVGGLTSDNGNLDARVSELLLVNDGLEESLRLLGETNVEMESLVKRTLAKMEDMNKTYIPSDTTVGDEAFVKLVFKKDNYEHVTPTISITNDSFEQLFAIRSIDDSQSDNKNAIRLALLNLGREALEQICSDFMGDVE